MQTYLQTLNTDNTSPNASLNPFTEEPEFVEESDHKEEEAVIGDAPHLDALEDDQPSARSARSGSGSSSKSQNEIIEVSCRAR